MKNVSQKILKELNPRKKEDNYTAKSIAEVIDHFNDDYAIKIENRTTGKATKWLDIDGTYIVDLYYDVSDLEAKDFNEVELNETYYSRKAQADYDKWSTVHTYTGRVKDKIKEVKEKIDSGELKDIKEISKALQEIIDSDF